MDIPRRLAGRYRLDTVLGRGGMGIVWLARDELLGRDVAVKEIFLPAEITAEEKETLRRRTLREARASARLSHPNIVGLYDVVEEENRPWLVMELVISRSLSEVIRDDGPLTPQQAAEIGRQILAALLATHAAGIVHRDVKPSNVLLGEDGRVVLSDFGIASARGMATLTASGVLIGSPRYMPPERARGKRGGPESDLWSLGATLYAAVEGHPPYDREGAVATLAAVITQEPDPPHRAGPLWPLISALLQSDPAQRPSIAQAEQMLAQIPKPPAPPAIPSARAPEPAPTGTPPAAPTGTPPANAARAAPEGTRPAEVASPSSPGAANPHAADPVAAPPHAADPVAAAPEVAEAPATGAANASSAAEVAEPAPAAIPPAAAAPSESRKPAAAEVAGSSAAQVAGTPAADDAAVPRAAEPGPAVTIPSALPVQPAHRQTAERHPAGPAHGRSWHRIAAVVVAVAVVVGGLVAWDLAGGRRHKAASRAAIPSPSRGSSHGPPSTTPSRSSRAEPSSSPSGFGPLSGGAHWYHDPTGFSIGIPAGWNVAHQGHYVYVRDSGSGRYLLIDQSTTPQADPLADWRQQEAARIGTYPGYHRLRLAEVSYPQAQKAADWEFTYNGDSGRVHILNRNILAGPHQAYALFWSTPDDQWAHSWDYFQLFASTFRPAGNG